MHQDKVATKTENHAWILENYSRWVPGKLTRYVAAPRSYPPSPDKRLLGEVVQPIDFGEQETQRYCLYTYACRYRFAFKSERAIKLTG
jgi:hypothetical protein